MNFRVTENLKLFSKLCQKDILFNPRFSKHDIEFIFGFFLNVKNRTTNVITFNYFFQFCGEWKEEKRKMHYLWIWRKQSSHHHSFFLCDRSVFYVVIRRWKFFIWEGTQFYLILNLFQTFSINSIHHVSS
jgi:hypothetical protein